MQDLGQEQHINIALLKKLLTEEKKIPREWMHYLVSRFIIIAKNEPNAIFIQEHVIIIGDIHGQFYDLLKILSLCPSMETEPKEHLLFLGDYVDRGPMGVEVLILLMAMKVKYPKKVIMLRGNHETRLITQTFTFLTETTQKYDQKLYFHLMDAFDALPLVCIVNSNLFCVHGGITEKAQSIDQLNKINRFQEIPEAGSLCDLVWADPASDNDGRTFSDQPFEDNRQRGCSITFGCQHARGFLKRQKLMTIIRAHEVQLQGYKQHFWPKWKDIPMVYTLFSAPNYCGSYGNLGAILTIVNSQFNIRQFKETNPKYYIPQKYNAFTFSGQLIYSNTNIILKHMIKLWVKAKMPELRGYDVDIILNLFLSSDLCKKLLLRESSSKSQKAKPEQQQLDSKGIFRKSLNYYQISQKRPKSHNIKR